MMVVAIVAILAAMAIIGVRKYVSHAKTAEVTNALGQITKDVTSAYVRDQMAGSVLALHGSAQKSNQLCESGPAVPSSPTAIAGRKYQSRPVEWSNGWQCLRFAIQDPQYYRYEYVVTGTGADANDTFQVKGTGDLDGDGITSRFIFHGALVQDGSDIALVTGPNISETNPEE
jgi:type IV pilus assembly protein PilA